MVAKLMSPRSLKIASSNWMIDVTPVPAEGVKSWR
jgi:hypothetical protein